MNTNNDNVNNPKHYNNDPSGVECIDVVEHMDFCLGNAFKYVYRFRDKNGLEDIEKAKWYLKRARTQENTIQTPHAFKQLLIYLMDKITSAGDNYERNRVLKEIIKAAITSDPEDASMFIENAIGYLGDLVKETTK
jgi:hypothetical protein